MSRAKDLFDAHPDRGVDGILRLDGPHGTTNIGHVADTPGGVLHIWPGPQQGRAPLRVHDPLDGDPVAAVAALFGAETETGR